MRKTMLAIAALTLAQLIQLSAAHAGGGSLPTGNGDTDTGLPAHHGGNGQQGVSTCCNNGELLGANHHVDVKPQLTVSPNAPGPTPVNHLPPTIDGPNPGPLPLRDPRTQ